MACERWEQRLRATALALLALAVAASETQAEAAKPTGVKSKPTNRLSVSTGFDFSTGNYGEKQATDVWYVPLDLKYEWSSWVFRVTVPYIRVTGAGSVVTGGDVLHPGTTGRRETHEGLGDVLAGVTYRLAPPRPVLPYLDFTARLKIPTASQQQGLGTGEVDTTLEIEALKPFGPLTPFASIAFRFVGDPPGADLTDTFATTIGLDWRIGRPLSAGVYYGWRQTASRSLGDAHEITAYASYRLWNHFTIGPYAELGLSTAAADFGVGLQLGYRR